MSRKIVILTEGRSNPSDAKTATGLLRYCSAEVIAMLDSTCVGKTCQEVLGVGGAIPFVASLADVETSCGVKPDTLLIGIAPAGGGLPPEWRGVLEESIDRGMNILSGLHFFLASDPDLAARARRAGVQIHDVRRPPPGIRVSRNAARKSPSFRVHTVGHDCGVGKLVTSLEIARALEAKGRSTKFVATGQTGILIAGSGVPVDAVVSDFIAGAIEAEVLAGSNHEFVVVEGQGSLVHPLYSGVTLGLLHGCAPQAMVMVYDPTRKEVRHSDLPMPPLGEIITLFERMASILCPSRVVALAANTYKLTDSEARSEIARARDELGLPVTDVIRFGPEPVIEAILEAEQAYR